MSDSTDFRVFVSGVSSEFAKARDEIASDLRTRGLLVRVQRDFRQEASTSTTLQKLDTYIKDCGAIVHVAGKRSGAFPGEEEAKPFLHVLPAGLAKASYTQFEFYLARHHGRRLSIYIAQGDYVPDRSAPTSDDEDATLQAAHVLRLEKFDRNYFSTNDQLCRLMLKEDWPRLAKRRPQNLPFPSLGSLFKGREQFLERLRAALCASGQGQATTVTGTALHGLGGVGKTRLAVEYALRHEADYSALLFVRTENPERLDASLAALAGPDILDLPEKDARQDEVKIPAALAWLENHPTWLMILDNVDDARAAGAVQKLLARLKGGHVLITGRLTNFPASIRKLELGVLGADEAAKFLLERTQDDREHTQDDARLARDLASELGGLALGLEQAGAYIATERISFARYLKLWREKREAVIGWFDRDLMTYDHDTGLAATWATSVDRLAPHSRRLLECLAYLASDPIPDTMLDIAMPGDPRESDQHGVLAGLYAYSLISRAFVEDGKAARSGFAVHRLVQDFTRRRMPDNRKGEALREALGWVNAAFTGDPQDIRTWPVLDPLLPHVRAVAGHGDAAGIIEPTAHLLNQLGVLLSTKARYSEAEPLVRRALAIDEASYSPDHPNVAIRLNNLAGLLRATNRLGEAEPLYRRALAISEASYGPDHPSVAIRLNNLAGLLRATNRLGEAEPLYRRALAISEASYGPDHPNVATCVNNLAELLRATNRLGEAEPLYRRALAIDEASYGPDHPEVATDLNNLAGLLRATNRLGEAEPLYRRALAIDKASYGPDHPEVATDLNNLAALLYSTNRLGEAEPLVRRALAISEASNGPDHPNVAIRLNNLAELLRATNRLGEAEPLYRRALAIDEASYGPDHPNVGAGLNNLAELLRATNRLGEAEPLCRRALAISEVSYGPDHPTTHTIRANLAELLKST